MEAFYNLMDQEELHGNEGERGVRNLTNLIRCATRYSSLEEYLADNPFAIDALIDTIRECVKSDPDMREHVLAVYGDEEYEDEDEEE